MITRLELGQLRRLRETMNTVSDHVRDVAERGRRTIAVLPGQQTTSINRIADVPSGTQVEGLGGQVTVDLLGRVGDIYVYSTPSSGGRVVDRRSVVVGYHTDQSDDRHLLHVSLRGSAYQDKTQIQTGNPGLLPLALVSSETRQKRIGQMLAGAKQSLEVAKTVDRVVEQVAQSSSVDAPRRDMTAVAQELTEFEQVFPDPKK